MSYLKAGDTITGQEAIARMTVHNTDGTSSVEDLFMAKKIEGKAQMNTTDVKTLGKRGVQKKPNSWTGTGSMTVYYVTSVFRRMMLLYMKNGTPVFFDLIITINDPASTVGLQTTVLKNCLLDEVILAKLDVDSEVLDEDLTFSFDDADMLDEFDAPVLG